MDVFLLKTTPSVGLLIYLSLTFSLSSVPPQRAIKPHGPLKIKHLLSLTLPLSHPTHVNSRSSSLARMQQQMHSSLYVHSPQRQQTKKSFFGSVAFGICFVAGNGAFATIPLLAFFLLSMREALFLISSMARCQV